jgi:hypothetical protein
MPFIPELIAVSVEGKVLTTSGVERKVVNTFSYRLSAAAFSVSPTDVYTWFMNNVWTYWCQSLASGISGWKGVQTWVSYPLETGITQHAGGVPYDGSAGAGRQPLSTCLYINFGTGRRGRAWLGCKRWGPVPNSYVLGDELVPAVWSTLNASTYVFMTPMSITVGGLNATYIPCVWSRARWPYGSFMTVDAFSDLVTVHVNKTLGQWRHRRESTAR